MHKRVSKEARLHPMHAILGRVCYWGAGCQKSGVQPGWLPIRIS